MICDEKIFSENSHCACGYTENMVNLTEHGSDCIFLVLILMDVVNKRLESNNVAHRSQPIDLAILQFFDQFRKIYIGDQVHRSSKAYLRMSERLNLQDESDILNVLVKKIITNLKCWGDDEVILVSLILILRKNNCPFSAKNAAIIVRIGGWLCNCKKIGQTRFCQAAVT